MPEFLRALHPQVEPGELLEWVARYLTLRPLEGAGIALATAGFTWVLVAAFREKCNVVSGMARRAPLRGLRVAAKR